MWSSFRLIVIILFLFPFVFCAQETSDKKKFVSVDRSKFMTNLADFINETSTSTLKTKTDYYLLINLRNQTDAVRKWMIDEIYKVW